MVSAGASSVAHWIQIGPVPAWLAIVPTALQCKNGDAHTRSCAAAYGAQLTSGSRRECSRRRGDQTPCLGRQPLCQTRALPTF